MSDTFITSDSGGDAGTGTAVTEAPEQIPGAGSAAPETQESDNGTPQGETEGSQNQAAPRRKWSLQDEIKELRAQRREWRQREAERENHYNSLAEELRQLRESMSRQGPGGSTRDPSKFWQDPEASIESKLDERLNNLRETLEQSFHQSREEMMRQESLRQEQTQAAEFIRSQAGYHPDDDEDLIEIIESIPNRQHLSPQWVAEFAWMKLQQSRGISDKTQAKHRASTVQGQPPGTGFGQKNWSKAEFDQALNMIEKNPNDPKFNELIKELEAAHKEGRVR